MRLGLEILLRMRICSSRLPTALAMVDKHLHLADMQDFSLQKQFDLAFVLMGSLHYLDNEAFLHHMDLMWAHLHSYGLYALEWCVDYVPSVAQNDEWVEESPLGNIHVIYRSEQKSVLEQKVEEQIDFDVNDELVASTLDFMVQPDLRGLTKTPPYPRLRAGNLAPPPLAGEAGRG